MFSFTGWEAETDLGNADDREDVFFLTIMEDDEEYAIIIHRTAGGKYPLNGAKASEKIERAKRIVTALNA